MDLNIFEFYPIAITIHFEVQMVPSLSREPASLEYHSAYH